jgi:RNA polymerase sigma factor (sigma-70 family)
MPPPPAEQLASRIFLGPALRTQSDRRLVGLVRDGYEAAFEEIVRRYRSPLDRFAAAIVGGRSEDVTQDAFSKALLALRGSEGEIELRPWLYRIVRNTALNDLRDSPPPASELAEGSAAGPSAAVEAERREEMSDLVERLRALPEPQRAAIVMRELEGLGHEEIAAALGVSGGAARQAIHRARTALRDGLGMLVPVPLLRALFDHGAEVAAGGAVATSAGGAGAVFGGLGAGGALKLGAATILVAGTVGAGVAIRSDNDGGPGPEPAAAATIGKPPAPRDLGGSGGGGYSVSAGSEGGSGSSSRGRNDSDSSGSGGSSGHGDSGGRDTFGHGGSGSSRSPDHGGSGDDGSGSGGSGRSGSSGGDDIVSSGRGSGGSGSGGGISGGSGSGDDGSGSSGSGGSGSSGAGSGDSTSAGSIPPPTEPLSADGGSEGSGKGSSSGGDGS